MRSYFDEKLEKLNTEMITLGMNCEYAIAKSAIAVINQDRDEAKQVSEILAVINQKAGEIENLCLRLLLQQQPVAKDLRIISSALKMVTDMERIGVQSADIAEIILTADMGDLSEKLNFEEMSEAVIEMVTGCVDAFVKKDLELARSVIQADDKVDECFTRIKDGLVKGLSDGEKSAYNLDLLMIAKYLERIGDHAVNIANWVIYCITGVHEEN